MNLNLNLLGLLRPATSDLEFFSVISGGACFVAEADEARDLVANTEAGFAGDGVTAEITGLGIEESRD